MKDPQTLICKKRFENYTTNITTTYVKNEIEISAILPQKITQRFFCLFHSEEVNKLSFGYRHQKRYEIYYLP